MVTAIRTIRIAYVSAASGLAKITSEMSSLCDLPVSWGLLAGVGGKRSL